MTRTVGKDEVAVNRTVFDYSVSRTSVVGIHRFAELRDADLVANFSRLLTEESRARELELRVSDALHSLVSRASSEMRIPIIRFRRDVFNRRMKWLQAQAVRDLVSNMNPSAAQDLAELEQILARLSERHREIDDALTARLETESSLLSQIAEVPELASAVSLSSPSVWQARQRLTRKSKQSFPSNLNRALFTYAQRGALKPSPLSTFSRLDIMGPNCADVAPEAASHLSVAVVRALASALSTHPDWMHAFEFQPNLTLRSMSDTMAQVMVPMYQRIEGQYNWRRDDILYANVGAKLADKVRSLPAGSSATAVEAHFEGTLPIRFLVDSGLVLPILPWNTSEGDALKGLVDALPPEAQLTRSLSNLAEGIDSLSEAIPDRRIALQREAHQRLKDAFNDIGRVPPVFSRVRDIVRENYVGAASSQSDREYSSLAATADQVYSEGLFRGVLHDRLLRQARELFDRPTGTLVIRDVPGYLAQISYGADNVRRYQDTQLEEARLAQTNGRSALAASRPVFRTASTAPPIGMAIIHHGLEPESGVLDSIGAYGPGQLTRYLREPTRTTVGSDLRSWVAAMTPDTTMQVEVSVANDQNDLQRDASGIWPRLQWPVDSCKDSGAVDVFDLSIEIDSDDAVSVTVDDGQPVQLIYVGVVPQSLISGPIRNLLALTSPWSYAPLDPYELAPLPPVLEGPMLRERQERDGLVLSRRTLICEASEMPAALFDGVSSNSVLDFCAMLAGWGFGEEVFVQFVPKQLSFAADPKPFWVSCGSVSSLEFLRHSLVMSRNQHHLKITEALPAVGEAVASGAEFAEQTMHLLPGGGVL